MFEIDLKGKIAWVTGGSRGIGRAAALALAEAGADVAVGYRDSEAAALAVAEGVRALGRRSMALGGDVSDPQACERMHQEIVSALGPVDILVNNAGVIKDGLFLTLEPADWKTVLDTNLMGMVSATRAVVRHMWVRKSGRIINVSSVAAKGGSRGQSNYVASKGAIEALTRNLAVEFASRNITVNCVAPGAIETDMTRDIDKEATLARQLVKRLGTPEEIAAWIVLLASPRSAFMTGQVLHVDGGLHMV